MGEKERYNEDMENQGELIDLSERDKKYFVDHKTYNCPYCKRRNLAYKLIGVFEFDWSNTKRCYAYLVQCSDCRNTSMHLSYTRIHGPKGIGYGNFNFAGADIDSKLFYSVPTSSFVMDSRIPKVIRELISEAEGCLKMNFLTGASTCSRKAIYELLGIEKAKGGDYESRIKFLKKKYTNLDSDLFDVLVHIQDMTSDKIHEQSWPKWDAGHLRLILGTLKVILQEMYVEPEEQKRRSLHIQQLRESLLKDKEQSAAQEGEEPQTEENSPQG